jgi:two-component system sensor histidine kinase PilS (NtrC family)
LAGGGASLTEATGPHEGRLLLARLLLCAGAFGVALAVVGVGREGAEAAERGLYATLAAAFLGAALAAAGTRFAGRWRGIGAMQLGMDLATVSCLVHFSGGASSIFSFLYLPITLYGAILFDRRGAYLSAALASGCYAVALLAAERAGTRAAFDPGPLGVPLSALWVVHTAALLLVALLSSALVRELRIAGQALHESASDLERLRRLHERTVESLTSGLLTTDRAGRVTSFNPEAERITGRSAAAALGRDVDEVLPGVRELVMQGPESGRGGRLRGRTVHRHASGAVRHLGLAGSILREADGSAGGHVVIFQDVTEVVAMERDLRRSERLAAAGQLSASMAHEIRNPLAAISGCVEMLRAGLGDSAAADERSRLMEIVLREIERLDRLIADFLDFARPAPARRRAVELAPLMEEVLKIFETARPPGVEVEYRVDPDVRALADPAEIRQLLWNLLLNASQAMPGGGRLVVAAGEPSQGSLPAGRNDPREERGFVEVSVSDTGVGIPPETLERIFDPFFTTKVGGSGLGLAIVHRVVEGSGGKVEVESRVGEGTTFRVRLLRAEAAQ